jgi:hypothetical protein
MEQDSTKPTLAQFKDACRHEFSFLRELGYSELQDSDSADRFSMRFSNGELTLSIRGENWGQHAGVTLFHMGGKLPSGGSCPCRSARIGRPSTRLDFLNSMTSASRLSRCPATVETCSLATLRSSTR